MSNEIPSYYAGYRSSRQSPPEHRRTFILDSTFPALWHLRQQFRETGKSNISRKNLNAVLSTLPRAKGYYSLSAQATRDEVIQAYKGFFALRKAGRTQHQMPGFRREAALSPLRYYNGFGFALNGDQLTLSLGTAREDGVRWVSMALQMRPA